MTTPLEWNDLQRYFVKTWVAYTTENGKRIIGRVRALDQQTQVHGSIIIDSRGPNNEWGCEVHEHTVTANELNARIRMLAPSGYVWFPDLDFVCFASRAPTKTMFRGITPEIMDYSLTNGKNVVGRSNQDFHEMLRQAEGETKKMEVSEAIKVLADGNLVAVPIERRWALRTMPQGVISLEYMGVLVGYVNKNKNLVLLNEARELAEPLARVLGHYPEINKHG